MDIKRLRYFSVLAETANYTKAAEKLGIAQSALSLC
ncbi:LysR family transcriptional regulator [Endozoicomonas sp. SCSIO W0465]|nr:LysR family transcriptional regulator [Endozoicomonas sp. SCSIO W0465]